MVDAPASRSPRQLVLITGASSGLGAAFARAYAQRGYDVALLARRRDRLEDLAAQLRAAHAIEALVVVADLAIWEAHLPVLAALRDAGRSVDILVNNAGFSVPQDYAAVAWERQRDFLMTLVVSACGLAHALIPGMLERGRGAIINVASLAGFAPGAAGHTLYPGAKSLAIKFSESLDAEYRSKGLRVTAICPGFTRTEFHVANNTQVLMEQAPRLFWQSAEKVVETAIRANEQGKVVVVPGWHNQLAAFLMRALPGALVRASIRGGAAKYRMKD